jgi:drug/metabolite transporter (DMT)-like permease
VLLNKFIQGVDGIHRTLLQFLAAAAILFPYVLLTGGVTLGGMPALGWVSLLTVGIVHTGLTYCMYFTALKELSGQQAAILSYIDPLVAILISVTVLGEPMTLWQAAGGILILGFTLWNELPDRKKG